MKRDRHPVRGFVAGIVLGFGVTLMLLVYGKLATSSAWPVLVIVGGFALVGVGLGVFGPTRGKRDASSQVAVDEN